MILKKCAIDWPMSWASCSNERGQTLLSEGCILRKPLKTCRSVAKKKSLKTFKNICVIFNNIKNIRMMVQMGSNPFYYESIGSKLSP